MNSDSNQDSIPEPQMNNDSGIPKDRHSSDLFMNNDSNDSIPEPQMNDSGDYSIYTTTNRGWALVCVTEVMKVPDVIPTKALPQTKNSQKMPGAKHTSTPGSQPVVLLVYLTYRVFSRL